MEIRDISDQALKDLFPPCRGCVYWEAPEEFGKDAQGRSKMGENEAFKAKRDWFRRVHRVWGCGGKILYLDHKPVAYAQYAPPHLLSGVKEYSEQLISPSPDAILISCLYLREGHRFRGLGRRLLQAVVADLKERGCRAVETYARDDPEENPSGPTGFHLKEGFRILRTERSEEMFFSLMRVEL